MKLTAFLLLVGLQVSALGGSAQRITISKQNVPLAEVLREIYRQTGYAFTYSNIALEKASQVSVKFRNVSLEDALQICFRDQPLEYTIILSDRIVVVKEKKPVVHYPFYELLVPPVRDIAGRVVDNSGAGLPGISIQVKGSKIGTSTGADGSFILRSIPDNVMLVVSGVNIETQEVAVGNRPFLEITVMHKVTESEAVVVNTGYQTIPKERATGSYSTVNTSMLERRPVSDIISKLEGLVSGLSFHRTSFEEQPKLVVRGRSTIYANDQPLIVVDGFPIEGDINSINPNDVQSVTVLKDAAAASIWGVRAGNGVIVIVTKKGKFNQKPAVELRTQYKIGAKPDLFYVPLMTTSDYVDLEQKWFSEGRYDNYETAPWHQRPVISDGVWIMMDEKNGRLTPAEARQQLDALRGIDVRNEAADVLYRNAVHQQHMVNVSGGAEFIRYFFSAGYDKELSQVRGNAGDRITIRTDNTFKITPQINLNIALNSTWGKLGKNGLGLEGFQGDSRMGLNIYNSEQYAYFPYQRLRDAQGKAVAVPRRMNQAYNDYLGNIGFQDWMFRPADELTLRDNTTRQNHIRFATGLDYRILKSLKLDLKYQYERSIDNLRNLKPLGLFYTRDLINQFTTILPDSSGVINNVPVGDILDSRITEITSHVFRGQMDYTKAWNDRKHSIAVIGGLEVREVKNESAGKTYYGYDDRTLNFVDVDNTKFYRTFPGNNSDRIRSDDYFYYQADRYVSFYANAAYTLLDKYIFSASGRIDKSNLFGVNPKDRNVPLWSAGASWNIAQEAFFKSHVVSGLKLRTTYGFSGNIDKSQTAFPVAYTYRDYYTGLPVASVNLPGNPLLQWEKVNQLNIGVDIGLWNDAVTASVEWFGKKGIDLLGEHFLDPSSGFSTIRANVASMKGSGFDFELNATAGKKLIWQTRFLFSHAKDKIVDIATSNDNDIFSNGTMRFMTADRDIRPLKGKPVYAIYSYRYGGLDENGDPTLLDAEGKRGNYNEILVGLSPDKLVYHGPAQPLFFGGWNNSFGYKGFTLSGTFTYKFGHKFRRGSINYNSLTNGSFRSTGHADYAKRWQKPGDEAFTNVPRLQDVFANDQFRDPAYLYSDVLIENASHIRMKDITLSYDLPIRKSGSKSIKGLQVYLFAENIGILWRANKAGIDPDYVPLSYSTSLPMPFTLTAGLKVEL